MQEAMHPARCLLGGALVSELSGQILSDNNIRTLVYFFGIQLDHRIAQLFENTPYEKLRASDNRVFISATRGIKTISDIARHLHISRQSAQSSVGRLVKYGLLKLDQHPTSNREKLVVITKQGHRASAYLCRYKFKIIFTT